MAISGDYSTPVLVNGFQCRNCSEVDRAKRFVDPAHPEAGPFGMNDRTKAKASHFSAEARDTGLLQQLHDARTRPTAPAAAAYAVLQAGAGQFVNINA